MRTLTFIKTPLKFICLGIIFLFNASLAEAQIIDVDVPMGWGVVPGYGVESITGGANGDVVVAKTYDELLNYAAQSLPLTIRVEGTIVGAGGASGRVNVKSDKTIIGVGADATLTGVELNVGNVHNVIIRNLTIKNSRDGIGVGSLSHHVWIDHCDVSHCDDGAIDITNQADLNTVSWTRLSDHDKTMLINGGSEHFEDAGYLNTTVHHMWWDGSNQRNPRVAFGKVHVFNCQYNSNGAYGIGLHTRGLVLAENNYFEGTHDPIHQMYRADPADIYHGYCESVGNIFNKCSGSIDDEGVSFRVDDYYLYDFILDETVNVPAIVKENVGPNAKYGELGLLPTPGQGVVTKNTTPTLRWTKGASATAYKVYFGETNSPALVETTSELTYNPGTLKEGTFYYWRVDQETPNGLVEGKLWIFRTAGTVPGRPTVTISSPINVVSINNKGDLEITAIASDNDGSIVGVEFFDGKKSLGIDNSSPYSAVLLAASAGMHMFKAKVTDNEGNTYTSDVEFVDVRYRIPGLADGYGYRTADNSSFETGEVVNVAYGANGIFNYIYNVAGTVNCNSEVFGDPIQGVAKACYVQPSPVPYVGFVRSYEGKDFDAPAKIIFYAMAIDNEEAIDSVEFFNNNVLIGKIDVKTNKMATFVWKDVPEGNYKITAKATDSDGNSSSTEVMNFTVNGGVGVPDFGIDAITLFPNPVTENLSIDLHGFAGNTNLILSNIKGQTIIDKSFDGSEYKLDLRSLPNGLYNIVLINNRGRFDRKIIKK